MKIPFSIDFTGKVVVVTGGAGILGGYWAEAFARCGAKVAILDRSFEQAEQKAAEIIAEGFTAIGIEANVLEKESLGKAHAIILEAFGPCDILLNGAGGNNPKGTTTREYLYEEDIMEENKELVTFFDLDEQGIRFVFDLNLLGTLLPCQEFAKDMVGRKGCNIINVSSMNAFTPLTKIPAYSGAKAAVSNFTKWLAVHFSKVGIRVNAIAPGFLITKQNETLLMNADGSLTERSHKILNATPMGRFGEPDELTGALLFLADEGASSFINGIVLPIDGGFSAYSGV
ncbi:MAG: oxidoreductase [Herbinix sp.]|jgi:NAD(P)-dependent dehydrogenase (short-subunit alcohol dehydrogenase family)|nr:oxidoreductase [Herbinix sp.]